MTTVMLSLVVWLFSLREHRSEAAFLIPESPTYWSSPWTTAARSAAASRRREMTQLRNAPDASAAAALERTKKQLEKLHLQQKHRARSRPLSSPSSTQATTTPLDDIGLRRPVVARKDFDEEQEDMSLDPLGAERDRMYREYLQQPANALKEECKRRNLSRKGSKPDLSLRLARYDLIQTYGDDDDVDYSSREEMEYSLESDDYEQDLELGSSPESSDLERQRPSRTVLTQFASLRLSPAASQALTRANFYQPSSIQQVAIPHLSRSQSAILHAETGSGKTLVYLLPITERLWKNNNMQGPFLALILTPTRELAAQVAGVAQALAPPGTVRLITHPTHLVKNERGISESSGNTQMPQLYIGSAKAIEQSLFGAPNLPAPPTPKPLALQFLQQVRYLVLDEVDRLLGTSSSSSSSRTVPSNKTNKKRAGPPVHIHEKPAAIVAAAVARHSLGQSQIVAASATVGRSLRRELARVLGLTPDECPPVLRGVDLHEASDVSSTSTAAVAPATTRAVTIPDSVQHYIYVSSDASPGSVLTSAYQVIQQLSSSGRPQKMLLVLTRGFGISTANAVGALKHFQCEPTPISLLDALQSTLTSDTSDNIDDGTSLSLIEQHRQISGVAPAGIGEGPSAAHINASQKEGYLLVTGEDTVRGLHLDGLDVVLVAGKPQGVDEYTHIAGRTGRAGKVGKVINVVHSVASLKSWQTMLKCQFEEVTLDDVGQWP